MGYLLTQATGAPLPSGFDSARGRIEIEPTPAYAADDPNTIGVAMFILTTLDAERPALAIIDSIFKPDYANLDWSTSTP